MSTCKYSVQQHKHTMSLSLESSVINTDTVQHDAVLDYYGRRLATCSSDKTIKIFEIEGETQRLTETLKGYGHLLLAMEIEDVLLLTMGL